MLWAFVLYAQLYFRGESWFESWGGAFLRCVFVCTCWLFFFLGAQFFFQRRRVLLTVWTWSVKDSLRAFFCYTPRCKWIWFGFEGPHRVSYFKNIVSVFVDDVSDWRPDFVKDNIMSAISTRVEVEEDAWGFRLMCSSLRSVAIWARGLVVSISKVCFSSTHLDSVLILRPFFVNRNYDF